MHGKNPAPASTSGGRQSCPGQNEHDCIFIHTYRSPASPGRSQDHSHLSEQALLQLGLLLELELLTSGFVVVGGFVVVVLVVDELLELLLPQSQSFSSLHLEGQF
jgi:hypothetical protein